MMMMTMMMTLKLAQLAKLIRNHFVPFIFLMSLFCTCVSIIIQSSLFSCVIKKNIRNLFCSVYLSNESLLHMRFDYNSIESVFLLFKKMHRNKSRAVPIQVPSNKENSIGFHIASGKFSISKNRMLIIILYVSCNRLATLCDLLANFLQSSCELLRPSCERFPLHAEQV